MSSDPLVSQFSDPEKQLRVHVLFESQDLTTPNGASFLRLIIPLGHPLNADRTLLSSGSALPPDPVDVVIIDRLWRADLTVELQDELFAQLAQRRLPYLYSIDDDLLCDPTDGDRVGLPTPQQANLIRRFLRNACGTIASTAILAERLTPLTSCVRYLPNQIDERLIGRPPGIQPTAGPMCFGYMGTPTHLEDLLLVTYPLRRVLARHADVVRFEVIGVAEQAAIEALFPGLPVTVRQVPADAVRYPDFMRWMAREVHWHFAIAPLRDDVFNAAKSDLKLLDYGALGIPGIFSATPPFANSVRQAETGLLVANRATDWEDALTRMIENQSLRAKLAAGARDYVWNERTLSQQAPRWPQVIAELLNRPDDSAAAKAVKNVQTTNIPHFYWRTSPDLSRRREDILFFCDTAGKGLEIGPSFSPLAPKGSGFDIETVDHASAEELREKYRDQGVDISAIQEVDYIWRGGSLCDLIGQRGRYDYILASNLIEHVPDIVAFLRDCEALLTDTGVLSLAVPDFRWCFDVLRGVSSTGDVVQAYLDARQRHAPGTVLDHFASMALRNGRPSWPRDDRAELKFASSWSQATAMFERARASDAYLDVHAWRFTPSSFRAIIGDLRRLELTGLTEKGGFLTGGWEFYITLHRGPAPSDQERLPLLKAAMTEWGSLTC